MSQSCAKIELLHFAQLDTLVVEQVESWWIIVSNDTFAEITVPYPNTQLLCCKYVFVDNSQRSMHVKTASDSSQLCQRWLGCRTEAASDHAFHLGCKWKIPSQIPPDCKKLQSSSRNKGNRLTTVALQNTVVLKIHPNQTSVCVTLTSGCTAV